jgi:hypothetical protein
MKECPTGIFIYICACVVEGRVYNNNKRRPLYDIITICAGKHTLRLYCECSLKSNEDSYLATPPFHSSITSLNSCFSIIFCFFSFFFFSNDETIIENNSRRRLTVIIVSGIELYIRARFTPLKYIHIYIYI